MMEIEHRPGRFEGRVGDQGCELEYRLEAGRVVFTHTGVPPALRGRGLAAKLVEAGLRWAQQQGLSVLPACSYVARHIERHPEWQPLLSKAR